jgi:hypothetical protein
VAVLAVAALGLAAAGTAWAHPQGVSFGELTIEPERVRYDLSLSVHDLTAADVNRDGDLASDEVLAYYPTLKSLLTRGVLIESGTDRCPLTLEDFDIDPRRAVLLRLRGPCDGTKPVRLVLRLLVLQQGGYNVTKVRYPGGVEEHVFTPDHVEVLVGNGGGLLATAWRFVLLGIEHIATGYDHILFLIALLVVGGGLRALIAIVTAFTVAHSVTLALATLDLVTLPGRPVEAAIALSIAWVALENIVLDRVRGRWRITFAFGLVHGFGFASILRDMRLPPDALLTSLVSFNLGVELGQIAIVLLAYPLIALVQRSSRRRLLVVTVSAAILLLALFWFVERALG